MDEAVGRYQSSRASRPTPAMAAMSTALIAQRTAYRSTPCLVRPSLMLAGRSTLRAGM